VEGRERGVVDMAEEKAVSGFRKRASGKEGGGENYM